MAKKPLSEEELMERIRTFARDYGLEKFLSGLAPEERLAGMKPEEVIAGLKPKELAQLHKALNRLFPDSKTNGNQKRRKK